MATTLTVPTRRAGRTATGSGIRSVLVTAALAAIVAAAAGELFRALAAGAGVDLRAGMPGETGTVELAAGSFAIMTLMCVAPGIAVAALLARFARRSAETFVILAVAATAASMVAPIAGNAPGVETRSVLCAAHALAAFIFVAPVVRRLSMVAAARRVASR